MVEVELFPPPVLDCKPGGVEGLPWLRIYMTSIHDQDINNVYIGAILRALAHFGGHHTHCHCV